MAKAALSLARSIVVQESRASEATVACVQEMNAAVHNLTRDIGLLDEIFRMAQTVKNNGENIASKAESLRKKIEKQLQILHEHISAIPGENN